MEYKWISTKDMTSETAPEGKVLVQYLEPSWGSWNVEFAIGYFDNPNEYTDPNDGEGWKLWNPDVKVNVIAYCELPEALNPDIAKTTQHKFHDIYGTFHPKLGCVGE